MDEELFLPVLSHFENGNFWTASGGALRYKVVPDTGESPRLTAEVWEGPWRYQDSTVEETKEFPLSEEGLEELRGWLARWRTEMNARPKKTLEETLAARAARRAETGRRNSMTWGTYYFFYECPQCGKKYRYELEGSADEEFGFCPECHVMGTFVGETKDNQQGEDKFADYEFV